MQQQELFDFRRDILFERENQIAHFYDVLSETDDTISYAEHIDPKKKFSICGMDYEAVSYTHLTLPTICSV